MWTDRERELAKQLNNPEMKDFLEKIFVKLETQNGEKLKNNLFTLPDNQYGQIMKVLHLTKQENKAKLQLLAQIATTPKKETKPGAVAPK